jgi:hypothetical protein
MSSDVFIISSAHDPDAPTAIREAVELAGVRPSHVQDAVFGLDGLSALPDLDSTLHAAGLSCRAAGVFSSLRAIFFEAASVLSDEVDLVVVSGLELHQCTAFVLASPEAVGRLNLLPRARLAARSLTGSEPALRAADLTSGEVEICKEGDRAAPLLRELIEELDGRPARWGMVSVAEAVMLVERI